MQSPQPNYSGQAMPGGIHPIRRKFPKSAIFVIAAVGVIGFAYGIFVLVSSMFQAPIEATMEVLRTNEEVVEIIGEPFENKGFTSGSASISGSTGDADISFKVVGPNGTVKVQSVLQKDIEGWHVVNGKVLTESGEVISLVD